MDVEKKRSGSFVPMVVATCFAFVTWIPGVFWFPMWDIVLMLPFVGLSIAQLIVRKKSNPLKKRKRLLVLSIIKMSLISAFLLSDVVFTLVVMQWHGFFYFITLFQGPMFLFFLYFYYRVLANYALSEKCLYRLAPTPCRIVSFKTNKPKMHTAKNYPMV